MPKIVNHDEKRQRLAEAAWRIISNEGLEAATVRRIAEEANMSLGALRHYFKSQSELIRFSVNLLSERIHNRFVSVRLTEDPIEHLINLISELLPLDNERRMEAEIWYALISRTANDRVIEEIRIQMHAEMHNSFRRMIAYLHQKNLLKENIDQEIEASRLHALVDGLSIHNLIQPDRMPSEQMAFIVRYHLEQIIIKFVK